MKNKIVMVMLSVALIVGLILTGCAKPTPAPTPAPPTPAPEVSKYPPPGTYKWKIFDSHSTPFFPLNYIRGFLDVLEDATEGALSVEYYWEGEHPYAYTEVQLGIKEGACEMAVFEIGYLEPSIPSLGLANLPGNLPTLPIKASMAWEQATKEIYTEVWDSLDCIVIQQSLFPSTYIHMKDLPVTDFESLKGLKVRGYSPLTLAEIELLGAAPMATSFSEVPSALMTGVIDGCVTETTSAYETGLFDMCKYTTLLPLCAAPVAVGVSKDAFAKLDDATKDTLLAVNREWILRTRLGCLQDETDIVAEAPGEYNMQFVTPDKAFVDEFMRRAAEEIWPKWIEKAGPEGTKMMEQYAAIKAEVLARELV